MPRPANLPRTHPAPPATADVREPPPRPSAGVRAGWRAHHAPGVLHRLPDPFQLLDKTPARALARRRGLYDLFERGHLGRKVVQQGLRGPPGGTGVCRGRGRGRRGQEAGCGGGTRSGALAASWEGWRGANRGQREGERVGGGKRGRARGSERPRADRDARDDMGNFKELKRGKPLRCCQQRVGRGCGVRLPRSEVPSERREAAACHVDWCTWLARACNPSTG